jgi:hypothetical protein
MIQRISHRRSVIGVAVALATNWAAPAQGQITANLQGYWQFNGNGADSSGMNRPLNIVGGPGFGSGLFGSALSLTGNASQYAVRPIDDAIFNLSSNMTVQIWANFNTIVNEETLIEKFSNTGGPGWTLTKLDQTVMPPYQVQWFVDGAPHLFSNPLTISTGVWHQFAARRNGSSWDVFFDGMDVGSTTNSGTPTNSSNPLLIGRRQDSFQQFPVNGLIDEAAIWNRSLSNSEIAQLYNNGNGLDMTAVPEPTSLILATVGATGLLWSRRRRVGPTETRGNRDTL